jgi:dTDP-4-amino-4,6-dideoxygalactose transaminase
MTARHRVLQGNAVRETLPRWPAFSDEEIAAVSRILKSARINYWTGDEGRAFEREYAAYVGTAHAIALANGTVSLELALRALGIGPGDEVITTPRTFVASAGCIVLRGAIPVFADVDRDSQNMTAESIAAVLTARTKAILPVHLGGWPCEMDDIVSVAEAKGIAIIEDCAQAHGATYRDRQIGSFGTFGSFSFCQDKIITTGGEGGMLVMNDRNHWLECWAYKDHGKSYEAVYEREHPPGFRWVHESFGTNWRLTELQSAIGRIQLRKLPEWLDVRRSNAEFLLQRLSAVPGLRVPRPPAHAKHAYYRWYAFLELDSLKAGWTRDRIVEAINELGVPCFSGSCSEIYLEKAFEHSGLQPARRLPVARELGETSMALLVHPTLTLDNMSEVAEVVEAVMRRAVR